MQDNGELLCGQQDEPTQSAHARLARLLCSRVVGPSQETAAANSEDAYLMMAENLRQSWMKSLPPDAEHMDQAWRLDALAPAVTAEAMLETFEPQNSLLWTYHGGNRIKNCAIDWVSRTLTEIMASHRQLEGVENAVVYSLLSRLGVGSDEAYDMLNAWCSFNLDIVTKLHEDARNDADSAREIAATEFRSRIRGNLTTISWLNTLRPGAVFALYDGFGIRNFGRYRPDDLLAQLDLERNPDVPLTAVVSDIDDVNGVLDDSYYRGVTRLARDSQIIFAEARFRSVARLHAYTAGIARKFGPIDRLMYCAHATECSVGNGSGEVIQQVQFEESEDLAQWRSRYLSETAIAAFIGCRAGKQDGIATTFAKKVSVPTFAFDDDLFGFEDTESSDEPVRLAQPPEGETTWAVMVQPDGSRHVIGGKLQELGSYKPHASRTWNGSAG